MNFTCLLAYSVAVCECHRAPAMSLVVSDIRTPLPSTSEISPLLSATAFDLGPSTSYGASEQSSHRNIRPLCIHTKGRRRSRVVQYSSTTAAAIQNTQWQHDCFAALGSEVKRSVRQVMMGWPADVRRFLAGALAGADKLNFLSTILLSTYGRETFSVSPEHMHGIVQSSKCLLSDHAN